MFALAGWLVAGTAATAEASPASARATTGPYIASYVVYELRAQHSNKCLDVDNGYTHNGANVKQWACAGVPQQHWRLVQVDSAADLA